MIPKDTLNVALNASTLKRVQGPAPASNEGLETPLHVKERTSNVDVNRLKRAIESTKQGPCQCGVCLANNYLRNA